MAILVLTILFSLANGQSRTPAITEMGLEAEKLEAMLTVCQYLARAIARDGEGATCLKCRLLARQMKKPLVRLPEPLLVHLLSNQLSLVVTPTGAYCCSSWTRWFL